MYCKKSEHKSADCQTIKTNSERTKILSEKKLCFNCATPKHHAADCRSSKTCPICKKKHHISISDKRLSISTELLLKTSEKTPFAQLPW